jgi:hypothetical protein
MIAEALLLALTAGTGSAEPCLSYNPSTVSLEGRLEARVGENSLGGGVRETVRYYALVLDRPVCVGVLDRGPLRREAVAELHVTFSEPGLLDASLDGRRVQATGQLHHRRAGRQFTPVLLHARAVAPR